MRCLPAKVWMRLLPYLCRSTCSTLDSFRCTRLTMSSTLSRLSGFAWEGGEEERRRGEEEEQGGEEERRRGGEKERKRGGEEKKCEVKGWEGKGM